MFVQLEKKLWDAEPMRYSVEAYLNMRKELTILLALSHPHIVDLVGLSVHPLSLVLDLAPQGNLSTMLEHYHSMGDQLAPQVVSTVVRQVSMRAL